MSNPNNNDQKPSTSDEENGQPSPRPAGIPDELLNMVGASPPKFVNFEQLMQAADGIKNMSLAHEIAVNNDFELEQQDAPPNSIEKQVLDTVKRAFWDAFEDKLNRDPPDLSMAYSMLEELKETLLVILLPQHQRMKEQINEVLDLDLIKQQIDNEAFDFSYYGTYITDTMAKLCAPARDEKIVEIKAITDITPKFKAIMETLDLMCRDMANFTIKQIRPYIQQNSIGYEREKFSDYFEAQKALGINALQYTEVWLKRSYDKILSDMALTQTANARDSAAIPTPANVMARAYLEILEWEDPDNFPETLMIDQFRFMAMRDKLHTLGLITSVQLMAHSVVGPAMEGVGDLKVKMKEHVEILLEYVAQRGIKSVLESISEQVVKDVSDSLASRSLPLLTKENEQAIRGQIMSLGARDNKVRKVMNSRLMEFISEGLSGKSLNNLRVPKGCSAIQQELAQVLGNFLRLTSHNRSVFGSQYAEIIEGLMIRSNGPLSDSGTPSEQP